MQDEGGIHVLTRDPLAQAFYISAEDAFDAAFTPDSKSIAFHTPSLRVEVWSIADAKRTAAYEVTTPTQCLQTALSTDGLLLGCLDEDLTLNLLDVRTSRAVLTKNHFYVVSPNNFAYFVFALSRWEEGEPLPFIRMQFSPEGHYFMAAFDSRVIYDLADRRELSFPGSIRDLMNEDFTFLGDDRILGINTTFPAKSQIVKFPSGERLDEIPLARGIRLQGSAGGDYLLLRPLKEYAAGAMDLKLKKITVGVKNPALDIYNGTLVHEQENGEISLDVIATQKHISAFRLPEANLGSLKAVAASGDLRWLAVSGKSRGAVWNVDSNVRTLHVRGFHGAWFSEEKLYVDMPEFEKSKRQIGELIPSTGGGTNGYQIGDAHASQYGPYILVTKPKDNRSSSRNAELEVLDVRDGHVLWSRNFPRELPWVSFAPGQIVMVWSLSKSAGHEELQHFGDLKKQATDDDYLAEVIDLASNSVLNRVLIKTNKSSFRIEHVQARGNWMVATATGNQILTYSALSGEEKASIFGTSPVCAPNGELLAADGESGDLKLYTLGNSQPRQQYTFPDPIAFKQFSADSKRLLVLTATQKVYILDVTANPSLVSSVPSVVK